MICDIDRNNIRSGKAIFLYDLTVCRKNRNAKTSGKNFEVFKILAVSMRLLPGVRAWKQVGAAPRQPGVVDYAW